MKKVFAVFLMASVILGNTSAAWADTSSSTSNANTIELSLTNIKSIIVENNLDMQTADNNLKEAEESYEDLLDDIDDVEDDISDKKTEISSDESSISSAKSNGEDYSSLSSELSSDESDLKTLKSSLESLEDQKTTKRYNIKSLQVTYDQEVQTVIYTAQQDYISYLSILEDKETKQNEIKSNEQSLKTYQLKYNLGFAAKSDSDDLELKKTTLNNEMTELNNKQEISLKTLKTALGVEDNVTIKVNNTIDTDLQDVLKINYDDDQKAMLENNFSIKSQNISIDQLNEQEDEEDDDETTSSSVSTYDIDNAEISLEQKTISAKTSFKEQYNTLMNSYNTLKSGYDTLKSYQTQYNMMSAKYSYGQETKQDLDDLNTKIADQNSTLRTEKNEFYLNYLRYIQMKEGY